MTTLLTGGATRGREALDDDVDLARDRALVTRAQSGDRAAFDDLYMRYYRRLYRFCLRRLHDTHEAEDVAQEAFARAWRALPTFGGDRRFYPWLSVIASHLCTDVLRRRNRSTPVAEFHQSNVASTEDGGEELMVAAVDSEMVARAFTRLSDRHQRILNLREGSGWSYQRIADHEGVGITAVETLLWRARQALKREFATLAGAEGRMGAWLGGALSLAGLRRLFRLPSRTLHRISSTGAQGAAVAAGSAVAATAMVLGAALSVPAPAHGIASALPGHVGSGGGLAGADLSPAGSSSGAGAAGTVAGGSGSSGGSTGLAVPGGVPSVPSGSGLPASPLQASIQQAGGTLQNVAGSLNTSVGGLTNTVSSTVSGGLTSLSTLLGTATTGLTGTGTATGGSGTSTTGTTSTTASPTGSGPVGSTLNSLSTTVTTLLGGG